MRDLSNYQWAMLVGVCGGLYWAVWVLEKIHGVLQEILYALRHRQSDDED